MLLMMRMIIIPYPSVVSDPFILGRLGVSIVMAMDYCCEWVAASPAGKINSRLAHVNEM